MLQPAEDFASLSNSEIVCWYDTSASNRAEGRTDRQSWGQHQINTDLILQPKPVMETDCLHTYVFWFCYRGKIQSANEKHWLPWREINGKYTRGGEVSCPKHGFSIDSHVSFLFTAADLFVQVIPGCSWLENISSRQLNTNYTPDDGVSL